MEPYHSVRPETGRSHTWPSPSIPAAKTEHTKTFELFDLDEHPGDHFLSPTQMYDDDYDDDDWWSSDGDDDDDDDNTNEVEWNAGITDFALFDRERRQASASGQAISDKWGTLLSSQASALDRAVQRSRQEALQRVPSTDSMPDLTPDCSPQLHDAMDISARPVVPAYLKNVTSQHHSTSLPAQPPRRSQSSPVVHAMRPMRPGLRDGRTLSGKEHVWRRPSWSIFTVREDAAAEHKAEHGSSTCSQERQQAAASDFQLALSR